MQRFGISRFIFPAIAVVAFFVMSGVATQANTVVLSENFDELTPSLSYLNNVGQFTILGGTNVDVVGGAVFGSLCTGPESGNCVDMDGSPGAGMISAAITFQPGFTYFLSFDLIGSQRGDTTSTTVTLGSLFNQTFVLASNDDTSGVVSNFAFTVSSATTLNLEFASNDGPFNSEGALLDNVLITSTPIVGATPEPSSLVLLATGLLGCGLLTRRMWQ